MQLGGFLHSMGVHLWNVPSCPRSPEQLSWQLLQRYQGCASLTLAAQQGGRGCLCWIQPHTGCSAWGLQ